VKLTASVVGVHGPDLRFVWSTSGTQGHLEAANSSAPLGTGPIPDTQVAYVADLLKLKQGQSDTVTVKAVLASDPNTSIGTATATVSTGTDLGCGPLPKPRPPTGSFAPTIVVDKSNYRAGEIMTVTINIPAIPGGGNSWDVGIQNNDALKSRVVDVLTLDGQTPPPGSVASSSTDPGAIQVGGNLNIQGAAETHVITFRVKTPLDRAGNPETQCAGGVTADGHIVGPYAVGEVFLHEGGGGNAFTFFNAGP
jgi:hypothetical protein